jgi:hypothetical protein
MKDYMIKFITREKDKELEQKNKEYKKLEVNHNNLLKRRPRQTFDYGNVIYIISHEAFTSHYNTHYFKFGKSTQNKEESTPCFMQRLSTYNTGAPVNYKVHYLLYVDNNILIEESLKEKYKNQLDPSNKEWVKTIVLKDIVIFIRNLCNILDANNKEIILDSELEDELNKEEKEEEEEEDEEEKEEESKDDKITRRCKKCSHILRLFENFHKMGNGYRKECADCLGLHKLRKCNLCKEVKKLDKVNFLPLSSGYKKICRGCVGKKYKQEKKYRVDTFTEIKECEPTKECIKCKMTLSLNDYHNSKKSSDGKESRCKNCEHKRKCSYGARLVVQQPENVPEGHKWCPKCEKIKEHSDFFKAKKRPDGLQHSCKDCSTKIRVANNVLRNNSRI